MQQALLFCISVNTDRGVIIVFIDTISVNP